MDIIKFLKKKGVSDDVIEAVKNKQLEERMGPALNREVILRIRQVAGECGRAVVVLGSKDEYRVYTPGGHEKMRENGTAVGKQNVKPLEAAQAV